MSPLGRAARAAQDNPNISDNLAKTAATREALRALLLRALDALLSGERTARPVLEAVLAAEAAEARMQRLVEAERAASALVRTLRANLADEQAQHEAQVCFWWGCCPAAPAAGLRGGSAADARARRPPPPGPLRVCASRAGARQAARRRPAQGRADP